MSKVKRDNEEKSEFSLRNWRDDEPEWESRSSLASGFGEKDGDPRKQ